VKEGKFVGFQFFVYSCIIIIDRPVYFICLRPANFSKSIFHFCLFYFWFFLQISNSNLKRVDSNKFVFFVSEIHTTSSKARERERERGRESYRGGINIVLLYTEFQFNLFVCSSRIHFLASYFFWCSTRFPCKTTEISTCEFNYP